MKWTILFFITLGIIVFSCDQQEIASNHLNCEVKEWNYSDYFDIDTIIQLETSEECLISRIEEIQLWDNNIYVLDKESKRVYLFDKNGRFVKRISSIGKGPKEYISLADMDINENGLFLLVWKGDSKLMHYDLDLNFIEEKSFPVNCQAFKLSDDGYFCYNANICNTKASTNYNLFFFDTSFVEEWHELPFGKSYCGRSSCFGDGFNNQFSISEQGKLVFYEPYSNKISYLSKNGIDSSIIVNYGEPLIENIRDKMNSQKCQQYFDEGNKIKSLSNVYVGADYIHFNLFTTQGSFIGISINGETMIKKSNGLDKGFGVITANLIGYNDREDMLISCLEPEFLLYTLKYSFSVDSLILDLASKTNMSDNPSLMFLKRKNGSK